MAILLIEISVDEVVVDAESPDRDQSQILEHLVRYCSKFAPLPAITVTIEGTVAKVVRGHNYLLVSKRLNRPTIRAVVAGSPGAATFQELVTRSNAKVLDWPAIEAEEAREPIARCWHVFYFVRPLTPGERRTFAEVVNALFVGQSIQVAYDGEAPIAEFEAMTPVTDHGWAVRNLEVFASFSREHVRIVSYQGRRFGAYDWNAGAG